MLDKALALSTASTMAIRSDGSYSSRLRVTGLSGQCDFQMNCKAGVGRERHQGI